MNYTAQTVELTELPSWRDQIAGWQRQLANVDWRPWLIVGLAAFLRFLLLGIKPPHFDEGINGWFVDQMVKSGFYRYDPTNYHGPLHFYVLFLFQTLFGRNLWALRLPVVLVSIVCVWLTMKFAPLVGRRESRWAALAMAVSPGFVFYGRYSIHEVWMLLFSMLLILGLLGLWRFGTRNYLWCAGMGAAGMILTKETYIIHLGCAIIAAAVTWLSTLLPRISTSRKKGRRSIAHDLVVVLCCLSLAAFLLPWESMGDLHVSGPHLAQLGPAGSVGWIIPIAAIAGIVASFIMRSNRALGASIGAIQFFAAIYLAGHLPDECELAVGGWISLVLSVALMVSALVPRDRFYSWVAPEPLPHARPAKQQWDYMDLGVVIATGTLLIVFFYSGTFLHWSGAKGLYQAYAAWAETGKSGHGHEKPWAYWLKLILRYEWPVLIGLVLCLFCQFFENINLRYLAIYGIGTLIAYSIVRYKTPWCIINIAWPFLFIFGAAVLLLPEARRRIVQAIMAVLVCLSLASAIWLNYFRCSTFAPDDWDKEKGPIVRFFGSEPYVYVQTYNDIFKLTRPVLDLAHRNPIFYQITGHMIRTSSYPFPWIFDDFPNIGYYEHDNLPPKVDADFLLVQQDRIKEVEDKLQKSYFTEPLTIRPYQDTSKVYFEASRFKDYFLGRQPDFVGKGSG